MNALYHLVWKKNGGRKPAFKHPTLESAMTEAARLSAENHNAKFLVMAVVAIVGPETAETEKVAD